VTAEYVDAMAAAVQEYGQPQAIVLFVVQPGEKNSYDQQVGLLIHTTHATPAAHVTVLSLALTIFNFNKSVHALSWPLDAYIGTDVNYCA
jgi:hypothetical protein